MRAKLFFRCFFFLSIFMSWQNPSAQQLQSVLIERWQNNGWHNGGMEYYNYDFNGFLIETSYSAWSPAQNNFVAQSQQIITNNSSGMPTEKLFKIFDPVTAIWNPISRYLESYNASNNLLIEQTDNYENGIWKPFSRIVNQYDGNNRITSATEQQWNSLLLNWQNASRTSFTYNANGTVLEELHQQWDNQQNIWIDLTRYSYMYNAAGKPLIETIESLNNTVWEQVMRTINIYNQANERISTEEQIWNGTSWGNNNRTYFAYNADGSLHQSVMQIWTNDLWQNHFRRTYNYNVLAIAQFENKSKFLLYPNPTKDIISIAGQHETEDYEIEDGMGRKVKTGKLQNQEQQIDLSTLRSGVYLFKSGKAVVKILKQ